MPRRSTWRSSSRTSTRKQATRRIVYMWDGIFWGELRSGLVLPAVPSGLRVRERLLLGSYVSHCASLSGTKVPVWTRP